MRRSGHLAPSTASNSVGRFPEPSGVGEAFTAAAATLYAQGLIGTGGLSHTTAGAGATIPLLADGTCPSGAGVNLQWDPAAGDSVPVSCTLYTQCPAGSINVPVDAWMWAICQAEHFAGTGGSCPPGAYWAEAQTWDCDCPAGQFIEGDACVAATMPWEVPYAALQFWRNAHWDLSDPSGFFTSSSGPAQIEPYVKSADALYHSMNPGTIAHPNLQHLLPGIDFTIPFSAIPWDWLKAHETDIQWKIVESAVNGVKNLAAQQKGATDFSPVAMGADTVPAVATQTNWASVDWAGSVLGSALPWYNIWSLLDPDSDNDITHLPWLSMPWTVPGFRDALVTSSTTTDVVNVVKKYLSQKLGVTLPASDPSNPNNFPQGTAPTPGKHVAGDPCTMPNGTKGKYVSKPPTMELVCVLDLGGGAFVDPGLPGIDLTGVLADIAACTKAGKVIVAGACVTPAQAFCKKQKDGSKYDPKTDKCIPPGQQGPEGPAAPESNTGLYVVGGLVLAGIVWAATRKTGAKGKRR